MPQIKLRIATNFDELSPISHEWDSFMESIGAEIFLTYDWCRIWWKHYAGNRKLKIMIVKRGNEIIAILPMFLDALSAGPLKIYVLRLMGSDYTPVAVRLPIKDDCIGDALAVMLEELKKEKNLDLIHLGTLSGIFDKTNAITDIVRNNADGYWGIEKKETTVQTYFELRENWNDQLSSLEKRQRKNIKRAYRQLEDHGWSLCHTYASKQDLDIYFKEFVEMHQRHWHELGEAGHFNDWPKAYEFHREVAKAQIEHDRLRLMKLLLDDTCLGYKYAYKFGNTYYSFLNARNNNDKYHDVGFNQISHAEQVKDGIIENVTLIDSMRGKYDHKIYLGGKILPVHEVFLYQHIKSQMLKIRYLKYISTSFDVLYYKIWRRRVRPKLKQWTDVPLNDYWIRTNAFSMK